jgi:hypothetical protein
VTDRNVVMPSGDQCLLATQIRDAANWDFRPVPGSECAHKLAGAYPPTIEVEARYAIPGRQGWRAGTPVPPNNSHSVRLDTALIFLPALKAVSHVVYLGRTPTALHHLAALDGDDNIAQPMQRLLARTQYYWRVDVRGGPRGKVWGFETAMKTDDRLVGLRPVPTRSSRAGTASPSPPPPPPMRVSSCAYMC